MNIAYWSLIRNLYLFFKVRVIFVDTPIARAAGWIGRRAVVRMYVSLRGVVGA